MGVVFGLALLASGLASTSVGGYAGSVIMAGLLQRRIPVLTRRLLTAIPALIVLGAGLNPTQVLITSQVILSFGIPFALVPLITVAADRDLMQLVPDPTSDGDPGVGGDRDHQRAEPDLDRADHPRLSAGRRRPT